MATGPPHSMTWSPRRRRCRRRSTSIGSPWQVTAPGGISRCWQRTACASAVCWRRHRSAICGSRRGWARAPAPSSGCSSRERRRRSTIRPRCDVLLVHGDADRHVSVELSRAYARGGHAVYVELVGCGHMEHLDPASDAGRLAATGSSACSPDNRLRRRVVRSSAWALGGAASVPVRTSGAWCGCWGAVA